MTTAFDFLTVACFLGLVTAFAFYTERDARTLMRMLISALAFAIANKAGDEGFVVLALGLILAGSGYALLIVLRKL
jgi:hypothetical protein